jgi:predicted YcjX-like family ATPase
MKSFALLFTALIAVSIMLSNQDLGLTKLKQLQTVTTLQERFNEWKRSVNKHYESPELELYRMSVFIDNLAVIEETNAAQSDFELGLTIFADLTQEEFANQFLGSFKN